MEHPDTELSTETTCLFALPRLSVGAGRLLDFGNSIHAYNTCSSAEEADSVALALDWYSVGHDIRHAAVEFEQESDEWRDEQQTAQ